MCVVKGVQQWEMAILVQIYWLINCNFKLRIQNATDIYFFLFCLALYPLMAADKGLIL